MEKKKDKDKDKDKKKHHHHHHHHDKEQDSKDTAQETNRYHDSGDVGNRLRASFS